MGNYFRLYFRIIVAGSKSYFRLGVKSDFIEIFNCNNKNNIVFWKVRNVFEYIDFY